MVALGKCDVCCWVLVRKMNQATDMCRFHAIYVSQRCMLAISGIDNLMLLSVISFAPIHFR